jgi:ATP-binding cassette subfamily B protein
MLAKYWRILSPFRRTFALLVVILVAYESMQLFDSYTFSFVVRLFGERPELWTWVVFFIILIVFDEIYMRLDNRVDWEIISKQSFGLYRFLKLAAIRKFLSMDIAWHQKRNSGTLVGKVADGVEKVEQILGMLSWEFVPTLIQAVLSLIPLVFLSPFAALIALISLVFFLLMAIASSRERRPLKRQRYDLYETEWHSSIELVQSVETNYMFGQVDRLLAEQENLHGRIIDLGLTEEKRSIYHYVRWQIRVMRITRRMVLAIWVFQLYSGTLDIPNLIFANVLLERLFGSFWRFARLIDRTVESSEGAERLAALLSEPKPSLAATGSIRSAETPLGIKLEKVRFSYSMEYKAEDGGLHDLSLEIPGGKVVAIVGPSGAGKTTIRKVITGLLPIQSGDIKIGEISVSDWEANSLLLQFSYVPQGDDVFLYNDTVKANIAFARPQASEEEVKEAAVLSGIHDFILTLPEGYNTMVGERGKRLSGGQKQRIALARAIIADRPILILDEATSSVDAITEEEIQKRMREILKGKTAVIIAHRLSTVWNLADKIIVLDQGRKVEEGTHEELVQNGGLYARMVALQSRENI